MIHELRDEEGNVVHACATASLPLPEDHWIYEEAGEPPRFDWLDNPLWRAKLREAAKYAVRASTNSGKDTDFDPDAMVQNFIIGMCGIPEKGSCTVDDPCVH